MTRLSRGKLAAMYMYRRPRLGASVRFLVSAPVSFVTCNLIGRRRARRVTRNRTQSVTNVLAKRLDRYRRNYSVTFFLFLSRSLARAL